MITVYSFIFITSVYYVKKKCDSVNAVTDVQMYERNHHEQISNRRTGRQALSEHLSIYISFVYLEKFVADRVLLFICHVL